MTDQLVIAGRVFGSRLIVGTGKYRSFQEMALAHEASGAEMVTVAVRRVNLTDRTKESLLDYIDREKLFILPNTAGCYSAEEAVRTARLGREVGLSEWVKLEVIGDERTLFPETEELVRATKTLVKEGFIVLPYTTDDLIVARKLIDAGASAVMPLGAPIGSGLGVQNLANMRILRERVTEVPLIVDAGVGTASDAAIAMELGADGVLLGTRFLASEESSLHANFKQAILESDGHDTLLSEIPDIAAGLVWPGAMSRSRRNRFIERWAGRDWALRQHRAEAHASLQLARKSGDVSEAVLSMGQDAGLIHEILPAAEIVRQIADEAERILSNKLPRLLR